MLASAETIETIADALEHHKPSTVVIDPVTTPLPPLSFLTYLTPLPTHYHQPSDQLTPARR